jgi:thiosulfate/3-mercaptopyruvate sulfurtransferase
MTTKTEYARNVLVDADWVADHIDDPNVRFVEVDVDTFAYDEGHIPGAVAWNWTSQLSDGVRRDIVSRDELTVLLRESGIDDDTTIVLYGDNNNWFAAWAYWQLRLFGVEEVKILDGGRKLWLAQGRPTTTDVPTYTPTGIELSTADFSHRAFRDDVLRHVESGGALVDVRSPAEFNGELLAPAALPQEGAQRAGHVPGAANIPWATAVRDDGTFRDADELRELYAAKGITEDRDVIAYCRIGERSSHTWFVLHELLGFERVRNYDGSWTEYGSLVGVPIEKSVPAPVS